MRQLPPPPYLDHRRLRKIDDKYVGGTLVAADIVTREQHAAALANPDLERPWRCAACNCPHIHVHDRRTRLLNGLGSARVDILIFRCAGCRVIWRVLPAFLARHLWRTWERVAEALDEAHRRSSTPNRTRRRWLRRLRERATTLVAILASLGPTRPPALAALGFDATRREVIVGYGGFGQLAKLAALVDRLAPGVRVM